MWKPASRRLAIVAAAVLMLCAAQVELVHGGGRPWRKPPAPIANGLKGSRVCNPDYYPCKGDNPSLRPPIPSSPAAAADVPPPGPGSPT